MNFIFIIELNRKLKIENRYLTRRVNTWSENKIEPVVDFEICASAVQIAYWIWYNALGTRKVRVMFLSVGNTFIYPKPSRYWDWGDPNVIKSFSRQILVLGYINVLLLTSRNIIWPTIIIAKYRQCMLNFKIHWMFNFKLDCRYKPFGLASDSQ